MINKQVNYQVNFNPNTTALKTSLQSLQKDLQSLAAMPIRLDDGSVTNAINNVKQLEHHLKAATDVNTGKLDISKFAQQLKQSNIDLKTYANSLNMLGTQGQTAFLKLAQSIAAGQGPLRRTNKLMTELWTTMKNTMRWQLTSSLLTGFTSAISTAVRYAKDLDKSLNDIRIVSGQSAASMDAFAERANKAAKALSASTLAYSDAAKIYYQQGDLGTKAIEERTEATIKMSNVTGDSAEEVSSYMTAIWNNFDKGSKSLEYFADVMAKLGAETAASTSEIATGLEKFAGIAETVGLSYEYATSALATLVAETRQSPETVGTALKTIFSRLQGLSLGETLEDGTTLNKYSEALAVVGVQIKEQDGSLKDMDKILDELGRKWSFLAEDQKMALAQTVGGVRQYTQLITLMENYDDFKINVDLAVDAEGTLDEQQKIFEDGWEASSKRVRASLEQLYSQLIDKNMFTDINNMLSGLLDSVSGVIKGFGGIGNMLLPVFGMLASKLMPQLVQGSMNFVYNLKNSLGFSNALTQSMITQVEKELQKTDVTANNNSNYNAIKNNTLEILRIEQERISLQGSISSEQNEILLKKKEELALENALLEKEGKREQTLNKYFNNREAYNKKKEGKKWVSTSHEERKTMAEANRNLYDAAYFNEQLNQAGVWDGRGLGIKDIPNDQLSKSLPGTADFAKDKQSQFRKIYQQQGYGIDVTTGSGLSQEDQRLLEINNNYSNLNEKKTLLKSMETKKGKVKTGKGGEHSKLKTEIKAIEKQYNNLSDDEKKRIKELEKQEKELKEVIDKNKELSKVIEEVEKITKKDNATDEEKRKALKKLEAQYQETTDAIQKQAEAVKNEAEVQATEAGLDPEKEQSATIDKAKEDAKASPIEGDEKEALDAINQAEEDLHLRRQERTMAYQQMLSGVTNALSGMFMMIQSIQSLGSIWANDDLSLGEKITSTIMSFSMALGAAASMAQGLQAVQSAGLILKQTSQKMDKYELSILRIKEKLKNKELTTDEAALKIGKILQAQEKAEAAKTAADTGVHAKKGAAKIIGQLGKWGIPLAIGVAAAFGIGMAINAANSQNIEEKANEDFEDFEEILDTSSANKETVKSYKELLVEYKKTGEGKEELIEQAEKLADAYDIEGAALAALTGNYDDFNRALNEGILKENQKVIDAAELSGESLNQYIRDKDMLEKGDGGDGADLFGTQGKYVENYDSYVSQDVADFLKDNGLTAFSDSGNNFQISGQNQAELAWQMSQARQLILDNAEYLGGAADGLLEELTDKLSYIDEETLQKVESVYGGIQDANLSTAFINAEKNYKPEDGEIDSIEELQEFETIFIEQAEALGISEQAAKDYFNALSEFKELRGLKTIITEDYGITNEEQIKTIEQLYNEFGATVFHPEVIPYLSEDSVDKIREVLKKVGHIEIVVEDIKFREAYEKWISGGYNGDINAFRKDAGLTGQTEWEEFIKHTSSDKYANTEYLVDDQGQFIRDANGDLQEAKKGQKGKTYLEGMGYDKNTNTVASAPGELPSTERYEQLESTLPQQAQKIIYAIQEIDAALGTSPYDHAMLWDMFKQQNYEDLYNIYVKRKKAYDEYKQGWLDFSKHSVSEGGEYITSYTDLMGETHLSVDGVSEKGHETGYSEMMGDQYIIDLLESQYSDDKELKRIKSIENEEDKEIALVNFINSQLSDPNSKLSIFFKSANITGQKGSYTDNSDSTTTNTKYIAPKFTQNTGKDDNLTYTENQAEAFSDNTNTQNNRTVNIKLRNGADYSISQDEYEAILTSLGEAKNLSDVYRIVGTTGMDIESNEFLKPYLNNILNASYDNVDFQDAYTEFIENINANQQKQSQIEKEMDVYKVDSEVYKRKKEELQLLKEEEKLIIEQLAARERILNIEQKIANLGESTKEYLEALEDDDKSNDSQAYKGLAQEINKVYGTSYTGKDLETNPELLKAIKNLIYGVNSIEEYNRSILQIYSDPNFLKKQTALEGLDDEKINLLSVLMGEMDDVDNEEELKQVYIKMAQLLDKDFSQFITFLNTLMGLNIPENTLKFISMLQTIANFNGDINSLNAIDSTTGKPLYTDEEKQAFIDTWNGTENGRYVDINNDGKDEFITIEMDATGYISGKDQEGTAVKLDTTALAGVVSEIISSLGLSGLNPFGNNNTFTKDNIGVKAAYSEDMSQEEMNNLADILKEQAYDLFPKLTKEIDEYIDALRKGKNPMEAWKKLIEGIDYQEAYDDFTDLKKASEEYLDIINNLNYSEHTRKDAQEDLANAITDTIDLQERVNETYGDLDADFIEKNKPAVTNWLNDPDNMQNVAAMDAAIGEDIIQTVILDVEVMNGDKVAQKADQIVTDMEAKLQDIDWGASQEEINAQLDRIFSNATDSLSALGLTAEQVEGIIDGTLGKIPSDLSTEWSFTETYTRIENYIQHVKTITDDDGYFGGDKPATMSLEEMEKWAAEGNGVPLKGDALIEWAHMVGYNVQKNNKIGVITFYNPKKLTEAIVTDNDGPGFTYSKKDPFGDSDDDYDAAKTGGGGDGNEPQEPEKKVKKYNAELEKTKAILENIGKEYEKLETLSDSYLATDEDRLVNLIGLNNNLNEQLELYNKMKTQADDAFPDTQTEMLKWLQSAGFSEADLEYDQEGRIVNLPELIQIMDHAIANALTSEEQSELEKAKGLMQEGVENFNEIVEATVEAEQGILDTSIEISKNNLEQITLPFEIFSKRTEQERKNIETYLSWLEDINGKSLDRLNYRNKTSLSILEEYGANETKINTLLATGLTTQAQRDTLEEALNHRLELRTKLLEEQKAIIEEIGTYLEEHNKSIDRFYDTFDRLNSLLETYKSVMEVIGKNIEEHQAINLKISDTQIKNSQMQLRAAKASKEAAQATYDAIKKAYDDAVASGDATLISHWEEQLWAAEDRLNEAADNFQNAWTDSLDLILERYELAVEQTISRFEDSLSPQKTLEEKNELYDKLLEQSDRFLTNEERIYELNKINRQINQEISKNSNTLVQQKLLGLQELITELKEDEAKITDYQLSKLQKIYDLRLAEIALEEAQNNKSQARLVRNAQGNWNYVFTANQQVIDQATQQLEDARYNYYNNAKEQVDNLSKEILDNEKNLSEALKNIKREDYETEVEYQKALNDTATYYLNRDKYLRAQLDEALNDSSQNYADSVLGQIEGYENLDIAHQNLEAATEIAINEMVKHFSVFEEEVKNTMIEAGENYNTFVDELDASLENIETWGETASDKVSNACQSMVKSFQEVIDKAIEFSEAINIDNMNTDEFNSTIKADTDKAFETTYNTPSGHANTDYTGLGLKLYEAYGEEAKDLIKIVNDMRNQKITSGLYNTGDAKVMSIDEFLAYIRSNSIAGTNTLGKEIELDLSKEIDNDISNALINLIKNSEYFDASKYGKKTEESNSSKNNEIIINDPVNSYSEKQLMEFLVNNKDKTIKLSKAGINVILTMNPNDNSIQVLNSQENKWEFWRDIREKFGYYGDEWMEWIKALGISSFDTGGYTGDWNSSNGRVAMLHEKEIVLNKTDTQNLLSAVEVLHSMSSSIAGMILGNAGAQMNSLSKAITTAAISSIPTLLQQEVHIDASFPGVTSAQEIENALNNIVNDVAQYAEIKKL